MADESKNEYAAQLQNFNAEQWKHFNNAIPHIFKVHFLGYVHVFIRIKFFQFKNFITFHLKKEAGLNS